MSSIQSYILHTITFFKYPNSKVSHSLPLGLKIKYLLFSFTLIFIGAFCSALMTRFLEKIGVMPQYENLGKSSLYESYDFFTLCFITILIAPIVEELSFRSLLKPSKVNYTLSIGFMFYVGVSYFFGSFYIIDENFIVKVGGVFIVMGVMVAFFEKRNWVKINSFGEKNFVLIFYVVSILFGYLHLLNFGDVSLDKMLFSPVIVFPFVVMGVVLGYVRIILGLKWAITLHVLFNAFIVLVHLE
jgi:hypothetical protein